jgi:uncharacterized protein YjbJ (UPF0337 family)
MGDKMPENMDEAKGRGKQAVGDVTGDDDLKREGKKDETAGKVKGAFNDAVDKVKGD